MCRTSQPRRLLVPALARIYANMKLAFAGRSRGPRLARICANMKLAITGRKSYTASSSRSHPIAVADFAATAFDPRLECEMNYAFHLVSNLF